MHSRRGVPTGAAMAVLLVGLVSYYAAYLIAVIASLAVLGVHHRGNAAFLAPVGVFVIIVTAIPSGVLWMNEWGPRLLAPWASGLPGAARLL